MLFYKNLLLILDNQMFLLFTRRNGIYKMIPPVNSVAGGLKQNIEGKKIQDGKFIYGIDYDYAEHTMFWSEREENMVGLLYMMLVMCYVSN